MLNLKPHPSEFRIRETAMRLGICSLLAFILLYAFWGRHAFVDSGVLLISDDLEVYRRLYAPSWRAFFRPIGTHVMPLGKIFWYVYLQIFGLHWFPYVLTLFILESLIAGLVGALVWEVGESVGVALVAVFLFASGPFHGCGLMEGFIHSMLQIVLLFLMGSLLLLWFRAKYGRDRRATWMLGILAVLPVFFHGPGIYVPICLGAVSVVLSAMSWVRSKRSKSLLSYLDLPVLGICILSLASFGALYAFGFLLNGRLPWDTILGDPPSPFGLWYRVWTWFEVIHASILFPIRWSDRDYGLDGLILSPNGNGAIVLIGAVTFALAILVLGLLRWARDFNLRAAFCIGCVVANCVLIFLNVKGRNFLVLHFRYLIYSVAVASIWIPLVAGYWIHRVPSSRIRLACKWGTCALLFLLVYNRYWVTYHGLLQDMLAERRFMESEVHNIAGDKNRQMPFSQALEKAKETERARAEMHRLQ